MKSRSHRAILIGGAVFLGAVCLLEAWNFRHYFMDDSYITFQYARNLVSGNGFTYNPGERVQGTTTPLYTMLMAPMFFFLEDPQVFSVVLTMGAWGVAAFLALWLFVRRGNPIGGLLAAFMIPVCPLVIRSLTMETGIYVLLIFAVFLLKETEHDSLACVAAALAFLTRFDGILLFPLAMIERKNGAFRIPIKSLLITGVPALAWLIFAKVYFGSFLPSTFYSKAQLGPEALSENLFLRGFRAWVFDSVAFRSTAVMGVFLGFAALGLAFEFFRRRRLPLVPVWLLLYVGGYMVINPWWDFHWYQAPLVAVLFLIQGNLADGIVKRFKRRRWSSGRLIAGTAWTVFAVFMVVRSILACEATKVSHPQTFLAEYKHMALLARELAEPGDRIAAAEIGLIGFYSELRVVDLAGLVSNEIRKERKEKGWAPTVAAVVERERPEFMVLNMDAGWTGPLRKKTHVMDEYHEIATGHKGVKRTALLQRVAPEVLPCPVGDDNE